MIDQVQLTWSIQAAGGCPACGGDTIKVCHDPEWVAFDEQEVVTMAAEIGGDYCPTCERLVSLTFKQPARP